MKSDGFNWCFSLTGNFFLIPKAFAVTVPLTSIVKFLPNNIDSVEKIDCPIFDLDVSKTIE